MELKANSMKSVIARHRIGVAAERAWEILRTGGGLDRWIPIITSCRLEGEGPGAKRVCTVNGQEVVESIETVDDASRLMQYRIHRQSLMPIRNVLGTVHLTSTGPSESEVLWIMNFDMDDEAAWPAVKDGMEGMYRLAIEGLEAYAREGVAGVTK
jgi:Polyketide cyclase / dehydrase and lipid transport